LSAVARRAKAEAIPITFAPPRWRNLIWATGAALVATRVVLLAHWASDVASGLAIGIGLDRLMRRFACYGQR